MSDLVKEMRIANFNSIKVQLEHPSELKTIEIKDDFNSIKVQLEPCY